MNVHDSYLTVTALTKYLKRKMEIDPHLQEVWIKGEISNFNHHNRGHMYLTLKDNQARIQSVMFAGNNRFLKFTPENGMNVLVKGYVSVFEPYGQYQLYIKTMEPDGIGSLYIAYEQLKEKLAKEGLFSEIAKKPIPAYPKKIGIITSPTGAAVRDIITTVKRRYSAIELTVIPVIVQGDDAGLSIVNGIRIANEQGGFDTLIVGRGGGSIEDLWGFNEEAVARAIFASEIPIISAVGHETDMTISDFVADLRAPTPTAAAELAVPSKVDIKQHLSHLTAQLTKGLQLTLVKKNDRLKSFQNAYALHYPKHTLNEKEQHIDRLTDTLITTIQSMMNGKKYTYEHQKTRIKQYHPGNRMRLVERDTQRYKKRIAQLITEKIRQKQTVLHSNVEKLTLLNPLHTMQRGFGIVYNKEEEIIKTVESVQENEDISIRLKDGTIACTVNDIRRDI